MRCVLIAFFLFVEGLLLANPDTLLIRKQYQKAWQLMQVEKDWDTAEEIAKSALVSLRGHLNGSFSELECRLLHLLGDCSLESSNYYAAERYFQLALDKLNFPNPPSFLVAESLNKLGNFHQEIKEFERALDYFKQALKIRLEFQGVRNLKIAGLYNNIGNCLSNSGDFTKALEYYDQALAIRLEKLNSPHEEIAQTYNNRGLCWKNQNRNQFAISDFDKALSIYEALYGPRHLTVADVQFNFGELYDNMGQLNLSLQHYQKSLDIYKRYLDEAHPTLALCYNNLGNVLAKQGQFYDEESSQLHQKALSIRTQNFGPIHPDVAETYYNISGGYFLNGDLENTIKNLAWCLKALGYASGKEKPFEKVNNFNVLINALQLLAIVHTQFYFATNFEEHLMKSLEYFQEADQLIDFLRIRYESLGAKLQLATMAHQIYDGGIFSCQVAYQLTEDKKYWRQAFQFSEKSKSLLLLEAIKKSKAELFAGIPIDVLQRISHLENIIGQLEKRSFLESANPNSFDEVTLDSLADQIFLKKQLLSNLIDSVQATYPKYYNLRYDTEPINIEWIQQQLLSSDQTLLEYFLGYNFLYLFVVNADQFELVVVALPDNFEQILFQFHQAVQNFPYASSKMLPNNIRAYQEAAYRLFQLLIEPVQEKLKNNLVIIPAGELELLPFDALLKDRIENINSFKEYPYLLKDFTINYNYSVLLLQEMRERKQTGSLKSYLGFAPEFLEGNNEKLNPLNHNLQEILNVQKVLGGDVYSKDLATKGNFLAYQDQYKVLHLATHGKAHDTEEDFSFLAFSATNDTLDDQSLLYVKDIFALNTNAELVVLSACETGIGEIQRGEGIASIARSFSYAGAKSMVATQWSVDDKATSELMQGFFEYLKKGIGKDQALRNAKLDFIKRANLKSSHPYYWASFISIGNMEPVDFYQYSPIWVWVALLGITGYLVYFWIKFKRKQKRSRSKK